MVLYLLFHMMWTLTSVQVGSTSRVHKSPMNIFDNLVSSRTNSVIVQSKSLILSLIPDPLLSMLTLVQQKSG